jgi:hypothetical protein
MGPSDRSAELNFTSEFNPSKLIMLDAGVDGEMNTGRSIYEFLRDRQDFGDLKNFSLQRQKVNSTKELRQQLMTICSDSEPGAGLILHFEFHGDKKAMEIGNTRERIRWKDLMGLLTEINQRTQCNLGLVMAGCDGFGSFKVERLHEPVAFYFQLAHEGKIFPDTLKTSLIKFYDSMFSEHNVVAAAAKAAPFKIKFAESIFADLLYRVCQNKSRSKTMNQHINATLSGLLARGGIGGNGNVTVNRNAVKVHSGSFESWVRQCITTNLSFLCGREPAYTIDQLKAWIVNGETLK